MSVIAEDRLGALWRAENAFLSQPVTTRVVSEALGSDPEFVSRFRTIMDRVSRNVAHPNAAAVFSYNWGDDGPTQFVVMEAIDGETLADWLGRARGLDAARSLKIIAQAGIKNIRAKSERQVAKLIELADGHGWKVNTPRDPEKRGGTVSIDMPNAKEVCAELLKRDVLVDWRPKAGVRMSPHFYTSDQEIETAISSVAEILTGMTVTR